MNKDQLLSLTLRQLRQEASKLSVPLYSRKTKAVLVDLLLKYQEKSTDKTYTNTESKPEEIFVSEEIVEEQISTDNDEDTLNQLLDNGEVQSALFLSRRLIANGEEWAQKYYDIAMNNLS